MSRGPVSNRPLHRQPGRRPAGHEPRAGFKPAPTSATRPRAGLKPAPTPHIAVADYQAKRGATRTFPGGPFCYVCVAELCSARLGGIGGLAAPEPVAPLLVL